MPRQPNYRQDRAERQRKKAARRDERLAAKAERRERNRSSDSGLGGSAGPVAGSATESSDTPIPADAAAMRRLAQALAFVCGPDHPATLALQRAAQSGAADDAQRARAMFQQLADRDQRVALAIAAAAAPPPA